MLKKRWIAIWMALIMLFSCLPVQVFAAGASITSERAVDISKTNATFKAVLNNPTGIQPSEVGIYFGETQGSMRPAAKDTYVYNQASLDFWYNANADMGITLKPATTYWYRFYAIINGQTVWGSFKSMQTAGQVVQQAQPQPQAKPQASFGNERVNDKTETNGTFYGVLYNPTGIQPSEVGCYIGKSTDSMRLLGRDTYVYNRSSLEVWYNANAEGVRLEPGTKYYYQFYAVIGGQKVMGDRKSVTTNGAAAGVHIHDWKTVVEKAHPHKSVRSCACGVSEVVNSSNYVTSCTTCNPPAAVKKVVFQNGTYEISNNASGKFLNAYGSGSGWKVVTIAGDGSAEQRFTLNGSNGNYAIQTQGYGGRGLYLNGTSLLTGQTGQFCFVNRGNGYTISPANDPSKVLTQTNTAMYGGDHVVTLQNYTGAVNQLWTLSHKTTTQQAAASFEQRTYAPTYGQGYFGAPYNNFPFNNGNCTWYVYGRAYEILGKAPVFNGNAADFWNYRDSYYGHSTNPTAAKPGAVMVWGGGDGGYGHVAIVEAVNGNTITISESSYGGVWYTGGYWGRTNLNANDLNIYGLTFKGYIYLMPGSAVTQTPATQTVVAQKPTTQAPTTVVTQQKKPYFSEVKVTNQTSTGAQLNAVLNNPSGIKPTEVGCYIGESTSALKLGAKDTVVNNRNTLSVWYDVNKDMGKTLKPGTTYYYQFYAMINGERSSSKVQSFRTSESRQYVVENLVVDAAINSMKDTPSGQVSNTVLKKVDPTVLAQIEKDLNEYAKALAKIAVDELTPVELQAYLAGKDKDLIGVVKLVAGEASEKICAPIILTYDVMEVSSKYFWNFGDALGQFIVAMQDIASDLLEEGNNHILMCAKKNNEVFLLGLKHRGTNAAEPKTIKEMQKVLDASADRICNAIKDFYSPWYIGAVFPNAKKDLQMVESNLRKLQNEMDLYETYWTARYGG